MSADQLDFEFGKSDAGDVSNMEVDLKAKQTNVPSDPCTKRAPLLPPQTLPHWPPSEVSLDEEDPYVYQTWAPP